MPVLDSRMRQLVGSTAEWAADDLVIGDGEIAVERTDAGTVKIKIGNGVDTFSELPYYGASGSFGDGYQWGTPARSYNTDYTSPDHPIMVNHRSHCQANDGQTWIRVNGIDVAFGTNAGNGALAYTLSAIVPPNTVYRILQTNLDAGLWFELRADYP